jgi:hypothetical protein
MSLTPWTGAAAVAVLKCSSLIDTVHVLGLMWLPPQTMIGPPKEAEIKYEMKNGEFLRTGNCHYGLAPPGLKRKRIGPSSWHRICRELGGYSLSFSLRRKVGEQ